MVRSNAQLCGCAGAGAGAGQLTALGPLPSAVCFRLQVQPLGVAKLLAAAARQEQPGLVLLGKQVGRSL